jgi:hypothetical protein
MNNVDRGIYDEGEKVTDNDSEGQTRAAVLA